MTAPDFCVIGGGIIGSWTALHLARAGKKVVLLDQFPLPHTRGSSHGASRAFRLLGDETLGPLVRSLHEWENLGKQTGSPLFVKTGLINLGPADDAYLEKYMSIVRAGGYESEWLDAAAIRER